MKLAVALWITGALMLVAGFGVAVAESPEKKTKSRRPAGRRVAVLEIPPARERPIPSPSAGETGQGLVGGRPSPSPPRLRPEPREHPRQREWASVLDCIAHYESGGNYQAVSRSGRYRGRYQFDQRTWDGVARRTGRPDLAEITADQASPQDQDAMAAALLADRGLSPWPTPSRKCR